jgi:hypothetical protein
MTEAIDDAPDDDKGDDGAESLQKQRRFLTIISLIVIAYYSLRVQIKPEAAYSGFGVVLHSPDNAVIGLWAIFAWSVFRYLQRLNAFWQATKADVLADVDDEDLRGASKAARRYVLGLCKDGTLAKAIAQPHLTLRVSGAVNIVPSSIAYPKGDNPHLTDFYRRTSDGGRTYSIQATCATTESGEEHKHSFCYNMPWSARRTFFHRCQSVVAAVLRLPRIIDHGGPLVLALVAVICGLVFPHSTVLPDAEASPPSTVAQQFPPVECVLATSANMCADILRAAGKNQFYAFIYRGSWPPPVDLDTKAAPPCKNGATKCEPWERAEVSAR